MSQEKMILLMVRGQIAGLSQEQQASVKEVADQIRNLWKDADAKEPGIGTMALALITAEAGAEE